MTTPNGEHSTANGGVHCQTSKNRLNANNIVHVGSTLIWSGLCLLGSSKGLLFVREEYETMYTRLVNGCAKDLRGVVLAGQPGIGESGCPSTHETK